MVSKSMSKKPKYSANIKDFVDWLIETSSFQTPEQKNSIEPQRQINIAKGMIIWGNISQKMKNFYFFLDIIKKSLYPQFIIKQDILKSNKNKEQKYDSGRSKNRRAN